MDHAEFTCAAHNRLRLTASEVGCVRGGREVFSRLNFDLSAAEALLVRGPNGVGKSSLLRLIAGLLRPVAGRLELAGGHPELTIAEQSHYLGHQDAVTSALSVSENLAFWARYLGAGRTDGRDALHAVGLAALSNLPAMYLSAGQRRRLAIARLIAVKRPIWLLDEPTSALDATARTRLAELMRAHLLAGGLIIAATHGPLDLDAFKELWLGGAV